MPSQLLQWKTIIPNISAKISFIYRYFLFVCLSHFEQYDTTNTVFSKSAKGSQTEKIPLVQYRRDWCLIAAKRARKPKFSNFWNSTKLYAQVVTVEIENLYWFRMTSFLAWRQEQMALSILTSSDVSISEYAMSRICNLLQTILLGQKTRCNYILI